MIVTEWFADWQRARWLKKYALQNDLTQLFGQLTSNHDKLDGLMVWLDTIPSYGQAVDSVATTYPEIFFQWFEQANPTVQDALKSRHAIEPSLSLCGRGGKKPPRAAADVLGGSAEPIATQGIPSHGARSVTPRLWRIR